MKPTLVLFILLIFNNKVLTKPKPVCLSTSSGCSSTAFSPERSRRVSTSGEVKIPTAHPERVEGLERFRNKSNHRIATETNSVSFKNHLLPFMTFIYTTSTCLSIYNHYLKIKNDEETFSHKLGITKDVIKISIVIWLTYYIRNFKTSKFLKSSIYTFYLILKNMVSG